MTYWNELGSEQKKSFVKNTILQTLYETHKSNQVLANIEDKEFETPSSLALATALKGSKKYQGPFPQQDTLSNGYVGPLLKELLSENLISATGGRKKQYSITDVGISYLIQNQLIEGNPPVLAEPNAPVVTGEPMLKLKETPDHFVTEALGHAKARAATPEQIADRNKEIFGRFS